MSKRSRVIRLCCFSTINRSSLLGARDLSAANVCEPSSGRASLLGRSSSRAMNTFQNEKIWPEVNRVLLDRAHRERILAAQSAVLDLDSSAYPGKPDLGLKGAVES